jgi:hypothetical protein
MAVVDFLGFRLIAMTQLPIGKDTLLVGTCDALDTHYRHDPVRFCGIFPRNFPPRSLFCFPGSPLFVHQTSVAPSSPFFLILPSFLSSLFPSSLHFSENPSS